MIYPIIFILFLSGCKTNVSEKDKANLKLQNCVTKINKTVTPNDLWSCYVNTDANALKSLYVENAVKVDHTGITINGSQNIVDHYSSATLKIDTIYPIFQIKANKKNTYNYEIGAFKTGDGKRYKHFVIWNNEEPNKREFEFIAISNKLTPIDLQINDRRAKWMTLCNQHDALKLVKELYTSNAVYYNHKPVVIGTEAIAKDYSYMNNQNYSLSLEPIKLEMVSENLAYEIGQCKGSYNGKYVLIWQKNTAGVWNILVDSNI